MTNKLASETSPYLQQHKDNPVDWFTYSQEAFDKAKEEDKPLFISIGYSSCHWCHVMARESFEDEKTAEFMNEHFVNIKVDREERPDIDKIYQRYFIALNGDGGGWPLSVWAFPDGLPFMLGTYFPKGFSLSSRSFMSINKEIVESWQNEREELFEVAIGLSRNMETSNKILMSNRGSISEDLFDYELSKLQNKLDSTYGGFAEEPKFLKFSSLRFLLQESVIRKNTNLKQFIQFTFHQMTKGGIYDQLGGGICRYSVDEKWLVPHFEKMLYDNAGLLRFGAELFAATQDPYIEYIVDDMISFLKRELVDPKGGFYSSINAESEGIEGKFYVWKHYEMKKILDPTYFGINLNLKLTELSIDKPTFLLNDSYKIAELRYGISRRGNFKDPHGNISNGNVLSIQKSIQQIAEELEVDRNFVIEQLNSIKKKLFEAREKRSKPTVDKKVLVSWNAMMITALFYVSKYLNNQEAKSMAINALNFILENMIIGDQLIRNFVDASEIQELRKIDGLLDDYAFLIEALIVGYEITDNWNYIKIAESMLELTNDKFYDSDDDIYYYNKKKAEEGIGRILTAMDESYPSPLAVMVRNLYKLSAYLERDELQRRGEIILNRLNESLREYEGVMDEMLIAANYYIRKPIEIVIIGDNKNEFDPILSEIYLPSNLIFRWYNNNTLKPKWEILENRIDVSEATVYICRGSTCSLPITSKKALIEELRR